jgi:hypothetical protein
VGSAGPGSMDERSEVGKGLREDELPGGEASKAQDERDAPVQCILCISCLTMRAVERCSCRVTTSLSSCSSASTFVSNALTLVSVRARACTIAFLKSVCASTWQPQISQQGTNVNGSIA